MHLERIKVKMVGLLLDYMANKYVKLCNTFLRLLKMDLLSLKVLDKFITRPNKLYFGNFHIGRQTYFRIIWML